MARVLKPTDRLLVPYGTNSKLAKDCGVNVRTVQEALRGTRDTETQRLIRERAIKFYGAKWWNYEWQGPHYKKRHLDSGTNDSMYDSRLRDSRVVSTMNCRECKHSYQRVNGTYCRLREQSVEYQQSTCNDYATKESITRSSAGTEGLAQQARSHEVSRGVR